MRVPWYPWNLRHPLDGKPTVGWLMDLCDENYSYLIKLAPGLRMLKGRYLSQVNNDMDLYMEVLEQTPYTTLLHLTYYFNHVEGQQPDPDANLRIYYDAKQVELIDLQPASLCFDEEIHNGGLVKKWKANLFLSKWLAYCIQQGHCFNDRTSGFKYRTSGDVYST
ncbi:DUF1249 domain-containing protein [Pseudomonadota bacterium]